MITLRAFASLGILGIVAGTFASGVLLDNYTADKTFTDAASLQQTRMTLAWDGTNYWTSSGGGPTGDRLAQYDSAGNLLSTYQPGLDFRSVFVSGGTLYGRQYNNSTVYRQTVPGTFVSHVTLSGGPLDAQSAVVIAGSEYVAHNNGTITRWDLSGNLLGTLSLSGYGTQGTESSYSQNRGLAYVGGYYLTYADGVLSAWDGAGARVGVGNLLGAGTTFDSYFSYSYADDGRFWVVDAAGQTWRGFSLAPVPEPATMAALGLGALALLRRRRK